MLSGGGVGRNVGGLRAEKLACLNRDTGDVGFTGARLPLL